MNYHKTNSLNNNIIDQILAYSDQSGYEPFWADEITGPYNHFYYITEHEKLACFIGIMPLSETYAEITGFTNPEFAHHGLFSELLQKALTELTPYNLDFFCEKKLAYPFITSTLTHEDYLMKLPAKKLPANDISIDNILRYTYEYEDFDEDIFVLLQNDEAVGFLKVQTRQNSCCVHNVLIRKRFRNSGCATKLLAGTLSILAKENSHDLLLHVKSNNVAAVKLYTKAGFEIIESLEYYRINYCP